MNLTLYNRVVLGDPPGPSNNRLLANLLGGAPPNTIVTPANAGDTINATIYLLDDGPNSTIPFKNHRYATSLIEIRLRSQGNNHVYAYGNNNVIGAEIAPSSGLPVVSRTQSGAGVREMHRLIFPSAPQTGRFKMSYGGGGIAGGGVGPQGFSDWINVADGDAGVQDALRRMPLVKWINEPPTPVSGDWTPYIFAAGAFSGLGMLIEYQRGAPTGGPGIVPLPTFTTAGTFDVQYAFGWNISVPLTAGDFTDLFVTTNGPAYLEVLLDGAIVAQHQLVSSITPGQPPAADFTASPQTAPPGTTVNFQDNSTNAPTSWAWNFGDPGAGAGNTSTLRNPSHVYGGVGTYTVSLTATNANGSGSVTKTNLIVISAISPPGSLAGVLYDGDHAPAWAVGEIRFSHPIPQDKSVLLLRQRFRQLRSNWSPLSLNSPGPFAGQPTYLVEETEQQDLGFGVVEWDRVWATLPGHRVERGSAVKTFKYLQKQWTNGQLSDANIATQSRTINCNVVWDYSLNPNSLSAGTVPDISIIPLNNEGLRRVIATGGFPFNPAVNSPNDHNEFYCTISGEIGIWMGAIYYSKRFEGSI